MEASEADIEFKDGNFTVAGTDRSMAFGEVALTAYVPHNFPHHELEPGLDEKAFYDPLNFTFPGGCHIAEVEIDPDTGVVRVERMTAVDDVGRVINPMIVEGQIHGRSEEHTSELQSLMRISYAVFCLKKKKPTTQQGTTSDQI